MNGFVISSTVTLYNSIKLLKIIMTTMLKQNNMYVTYNIKYEKAECQMVCKFITIVLKCGCRWPLEDNIQVLR